MTTLDPATPDITQFDLHPIDPSLEPEAVLGFYVNSTAPINVEDEPVLPKTSVQTTINKIARSLASSNKPQIVIAIHGYGTQRSDAKQRCEKIYRYAKTVCEPNTCVFLGYLWPSEKPTGDASMPNSTFLDKLKDAIHSFPLLPTGLFWGALLVSLVATFFLLTNDAFNRVLTPILIISVLIFSILLAIILLRLSTYFRDNYRATNYGVLDLVELIRQLDLAIAEASTEGAIADGSKKVQLSFIGHSMGCFIVTNAVRILSDVFDPRAVDKRPTANLGRVFCLDRLLLVAPDIPIESIMPRRSNFLRSSLHRCKEAYVFANEGDLALRLASTTANYFSFPARTRFSGYRLGNLTVQRFKNKDDHENRRLQDQDYGIVNIQNAMVQSPYQYLEVRASDREHQTLSEIRPPETVEKEQLDVVKNVPVSDLFTYFDCTDYVDRQGDPTVTQASEQAEGVVSYALRKSALNLSDYVSLSLAYFLSKPKNINVHGGYFEGILSQHLIYNLAFLGFKGLLETLETPPQETSLEALPLEDRQALLYELSEVCRQKGIQVVLAPVRYKEDILGAA